MPTKPNTMWDLDTVLDHIRSKKPMEECDLLELS